MIGKALPGLAADDLSLYVQVRQGRRDADITYKDLWPRLQRHRAENARQAEHILRLQIRCIAVAVNLHSHGIHPFHDILRNVELRQIARVLRKTDILAVDPQVEEGIHPVEVDENALVLPAGGYFKATAVGADFVTDLEHRPVLGRGAHYAQPPVVGLDLLPPGHVHIDINRRTIALTAVFPDADDVPVGGNGNVVPAAVVEICPIEISRAVVRVWRPAETP